ncbi:MAG: hypothetical protein GX139_12610 [Armatimonadetes bacterium]|jgi:hypothetical protein|nr:hypothetical protein [Armatimonadota bacterium]
MTGDDNARKCLIQLGPERLADMLIELAAWSDEADDMVKRATADPSENIKRFKSRLAGLKRTRRFIDWRGASDFARNLERMLADLEAGVDDPKTGVEMVTAFFEADQCIFEQCDDSSGSVGDVFRATACDLFVHYASRCADKEWLVDKLMDLYDEDEYGVRDVVLDDAHRFLPEESLRDLADRLWQRSQQEPQNTYQSRHWLLLLESIARQTKDAALYEKAQRAAWPELSTSAQVDIARVYLESGDPKTSLSWLERVPGESIRSSDRDSLLLVVYRELGDINRAAEVAWHIFRDHRSKESLRNLLSIIGDSKRERVVEDEVSAILRSSEFSYSDANFLIALDRIDNAEAYLLSHADEFDGHYYTVLLPLAEAMEKNGRWLAASLIYRALLDSILARAVSKYYHHGIRYLKKLDSLAAGIQDWRNLQDHECYRAGLLQTHGRKTSFWAGYNQ